MTEEYLREKLKAIEELSVRKEVREIYQSVFGELARYQEEQLRRLEEQIQKSIQPIDVDYGVDMFLVTHEDSRRWEDVCSCVDDTHRYPWIWEQKLIQRVYLEATNEQLMRLRREQREFLAYVRTNYETYTCKVALQEGRSGVDYINKINELMESNMVDLPRISSCYAERFMDVIYTEQKDRLRDDEWIEDIEIDWEELTPYIRDDVVMLCNVRPSHLKETVFPVPERNELRFKHELILRNKKSAYIVDVTKLKDYEITREEDLLSIKTTQKQYRSWEVYEIVPPYEWKMAGDADTVLSNRINVSIAESIQTHRKNTKAERYRRICSHEAASRFMHIEVQEKEIIFYAKQSTYIEEACAEMILNDLKEQYCGIEMKGKVIKE